MGGQPTLEALKWLKSQGVNKIVNLRTENENNEFAANAYSEETNAKELGFDYHSIPINGIIHMPVADVKLVVFPILPDVTLVEPPFVE